MRIVSTALLLLALPWAAHAYAPETASLPTVAELQLDAKLVETAIDESKDRPLQYAVGVALDATAADGTWDEPQAGLARWRLRIASPGAKSLSFRLGELTLPPDATLYLYTAAGDDVQGPFTAGNNGSLSMPLVRAEEAVLEARMPYAEKADFLIHVDQAFHGYRAFRPQSAVVAKGAFGDSGACEIDVACPAGNAWRQQIRAAVLLSIDNRYLCSGTLVNNSARDDRALILTANHCDVSSSNVTATQAYFNVEKSSCGSSADGPVNQVISGKRVLAKTSGSTVTDYTLFELAQKPPSSYDVYYAGWDVGSSAPQSGAAIHHPGGDDKKISLYTQAAQSADNVCIGVGTLCLGGFRVDAWSVQWSQGTTEQGSSGSALLNQDGHIVGTLSGGNGQCSGTANNGGNDYFARLDRAWTAASATGTTLQSALDTVGGGCTVLDGKDPGSASPVDCSKTDGDGTGQGSGGGGGGSFGWLCLLPLALAGLRRRRRTD